MSAQIWTIALQAHYINIQNCIVKTTFTMLIERRELKRAHRHTCEKNVTPLFTSLSNRNVQQYLLSFLFVVK